MHSILWNCEIRWRIYIILSSIPMKWADYSYIYLYLSTGNGHPFISIFICFLYFSQIFTIITSFYRSLTDSFPRFFKRPCFLWKQNSQELRLWISEISLYHGIFGTQFQSFPQPTFHLFTVIHRFLCISREDTCHFFHGFWIPDSQYPFIHKLWITMWKSPFALQVPLKYTLIK